MFCSVSRVVETTTPRLAVHFMTYDGTEITGSPMYVKKADTDDEIKDIIYDPGAGDLGTGMVFKGWTTDSDYTATSTFLTID